MEETLARFSSLQMGALGDRVPLFGTSDAHGITNFLSEVFRKPSEFHKGRIISYHPQTHSAAVQVDGGSLRWECQFADELISYSFGFSMTCPPREGEYVLILEAAPNTNAGIVVGRIPAAWNFSGSGDKFSDPDNYHRRSYTQLEDTKDEKIPWCYKPFSNNKDDTTHVHTNFRPTDVYPGEFAYLNQHNCGIKGGLFSATLLGGGASLRLSGLSNLARLTCDSYQRHSMTGSVSEFHNGQYLSSERNISVYQSERLGGSKPNDQVWTDDAEKPQEGENQTSKPRIKDLSGFFGNLSAQFWLRPDPNSSGIRVQGQGEPKEEGVCRETVDPSGQYRLSSAGMIVLERTGRIPVPVRKCYPTDKDHDISSNPEALTSFKHNETDPCYRQLELFDRQAYDLKTQYARVDGLGMDEPDYTVPQEDELKKLKDKFDEKFTGSETVKLDKFDKRRAGVYIGEDGSLIMRDAWGSEIVMLGGNVTISCAQSVMLLPGKSQLTIAGDDIVQKAQNSVDIHASEHDVRLSAARNMEIVGGADESQYQGGVIIESHGTNTQAWDGKDKGESAELSGITLRANKQAIVVDAKNMILRSREKTRLMSGDSKIDGEIGIGAKTIRSRADNTYISSGRSGNVVVSKSGAYVTGKDVTVAGESGLTMLKGAKYPIPLKWVDVQNVAAQLDPIYDKATEDIGDDKKGSLGFDASALDKMVFGFRTSEECDTNKPWAIGSSGGNWKMYEPAWVQIKSIYETLKNAGVDTQAYKEKASWTNGKPFPGKDAEEKAKYIQLSGLKPQNLTSDGFNVSRKTVKDESNIDEGTLLKSGYLVRK